LPGRLRIDPHLPRTSRLDDRDFVTALSSTRVPLAARAHTWRSDMNEDQSIDAGESVPQPTNKKLDRKTLLLMVAVIAGLVALVALNMK